jgi:hypothetical protein
MQSPFLGSLKQTKQKPLKHTAINSSKKHTYAIKILVKYNLIKHKPVITVMHVHM